MPRNRRNKRRNIEKVQEYLNIKLFFTITLILLAIIFICVFVNEYKKNQDKQLLAKQKEEIEQRTYDIFSEIENSISQTNQNILEADEIIKISAVGDILCGDEMIKDAYNKTTKTYDFSHMFKNVSSYINKADIVMGTMETNFANEVYTSENSPKEFAKAIKDSGINLVTINHNHSLDYGVKGLENTKKCLESLDYDIVGDKLDGKNAVLIKKVKDTNIAFLTYTYGVNNQGTKTDKELNSINIYSEKQVKSDVQYAKKNGAQYICVLIHWGDAISDTVSQSQKDMADFLVDQGVDIILGAHPSVVQPMEVRKNKEGKNVFIAYSIGTYISTLSDDNSKVELVLNIELRKSGKDGKVYLNKVNYTPIYVLDNETKENNRFELIDMKSVASEYASGNSKNISRSTYDKLIKGLKKLEKILGE